MTDEFTQVTDWFSKPGDSIRALMHRQGVSPNDLARHLDGDIGDVRSLLAADARIDEHSSAVLSEVLGGTQDFWMRRQKNFDMALENALKLAMGHADEWLSQVPMPQYRKRNLVSADVIQREVRNRMLYYNVAALETWKKRYERILTDTHFRRSLSFYPQNSAVSLWLRMGEIEADLVHTQDWNPDELKKRLDDIRQLTKIKDPVKFFPKIQSICAKAGVAVIGVKAPKGCYASGATRLVSSNRAMILLSLRHRSDDQFWFTLFHEIGHLLLHDAKTFVDGDEKPDDNFEKEANSFAQKCIIPTSRDFEFLNLIANKKNIIRFSVSLGVSPGLVVGQMQYRKIVPYDKMNYLKRRWNWEDIKRIGIF